MVAMAAPLNVPTPVAGRVTVGVPATQVLMLAKSVRMPLPPPSADCGSGTLPVQYPHCINWQLHEMGPDGPALFTTPEVTIPSCGVVAELPVWIRVGRFVPL